MPVSRVPRASACAFFFRFRFFGFRFLAFSSVHAFAFDPFRFGFCFAAFGEVKRKRIQAQLMGARRVARVGGGSAGWQRAEKPKQGEQQEHRSSHALRVGLRGGPLEHRASALASRSHPRHGWSHAGRG